MRIAQLVAALVCSIAALSAAGAPGVGAPYASATLPRSSPEAQGMSSTAILGFIEEAEQKIDALHSIMLVRHGQVVAEGWWAPYAADEPHMLFSLSKSFTSTAVGLAIADGKLTVDDPVLRFFPEDAPAQPTANLRAMRVRDLLTMSTGHHEEDIRAFPYGSEESVVRKFLALPVAHKPGTFFLYNTPASYMLSAIVQKVSGQPVLDYLRPRLFEPLGIANPTWEASRQGVSMGGFGLSVRTEDIARFGQLYLGKGMWQGKQLLPASWVETATARHMSNGSSPASDWEQGYGYQFWRSRHGFYRGDGAHGQFCLVLPQYDAVVAITSGTRDMASVMNLVWDRLVPILQASALPADQAAQKKLNAKLASLTLPPQTGAATSPQVTSIAGVRYTLDANPQSIEAIALDSMNAAGDAAFTVRIAGTDQRIAAAPGAWRKGALKTIGGSDPIAASGAWTAEDTYTLKVVRYQTPFTTTFRLRFAGDQLTIEREENVGAADARISRIVGRKSAAPSVSAAAQTAKPDASKFLTRPLVSEIYTADPSAHVFDGKIFIYPSHDIDAGVRPDDLGSHFAMRDYHVFSMDTVGGPVTDRGVALDIKNVPWAGRQMWAPDAAEKGGKYYLYFPVKDKQDVFRIGAAAGDKPWGPFTAQPESIKGSYSIDPAVFKDTDGQHYMYFGGIWGGQLQRWATGTYTPTDVYPSKEQPALSPKVARLGSDMVSFAEAPKDVVLQDENGKPLTAGDNGRRFFEGAWLHKYNGTYYFSYSTGDTHFIMYATGKSPYGPFTVRGKILEPVLGWTNHHSIVEFQGKWYLFYHDAQLSGGQTHLRNIKVTELKYRADGSIETIDAYRE